ncbi:undecaprenyldiphospho-muramoylpentapeptide beta-N-acetylglucosaminyltransferase [Varunaivibrio sulfuroxidans]|uniref:UDP-N-acetylglucosamine--N-acetylmuramyl-(pentapeptide) pyrophosphoryl-undecaprenol N-acetylglucosamine transferase n=1 Tax=Varunaivibrio sulfuroxidans TaxID=1773489 RepID=A0A4R3J9L4_9PROT|nr:undecaprenyldiphospho-muramoylpentapeptide beta-N-acetylglucosaminyltransferase [Varunaivibrio sulfuroxidans]TCS62194.1 UDP-N-acetylglucosamine-N-acetylmuramylpentapeptide N-acetylglucosamine transferase [Varunaivibrio sulfuroxidans]WES30621.1 undecaprenyldiphospho-muramoylpentapeptide beta-N-acetylglucosaminyltransferase [Varunaivibrio sulfuroxidans]
MSAPLIVLAAGGTGGHVFPAEALADVLRARGCRLALVTDRRGRSFGGALGKSETHYVRAGGLAGKGTLARMRSLTALAMGTLQARRLIKRLRPDVVVGFGGYPSAPTMLAATFGGYPTIIHEQNAVLGRANRLLASRVTRIATSFDRAQGLGAAAPGKVVHTGMPVRPAIVEMREIPYVPPTDDAPINLFVLGGSQGAKILSTVVPDAVARVHGALRARLRIVQQCRPEDIDAVRAQYARLGVPAELASFFDDVPQRMAAAHLVISRAGASSIAEIAAVGRPSILAPYPHAVDDHQSENAHAVDDAGAGWLIPDRALTPETLAERFESLFSLPAILTTAAQCAREFGHVDAAERLADVVFSLIEETVRTVPSGVERSLS